MTIQYQKISGVILAGGKARRMNHQDKGLVLFKNAPLISYAIAAMSPVVDELLINANRHFDDYSAFGFPVIADEIAGFQGALAGILTAIAHTDSEILLTMPCDSPFFKTKHLQKLLSALENSNAEIAVACDSERWHPVFLALKTSLKASLKAYLNSGERKIENWIKQQNFLAVNLNDEADIFLNLNTPDELSTLENRVAIKFNLLQSCQT